MRCKSHIFIFKSDKCMKGSYDFMRKTAICYFCMRQLKKMYGITESDLLKDKFYKKFISTDKDFLKTTRNF
jgi:hypothetical protein